jgi:hypothetical protein
VSDDRLAQGPQKKVDRRTTYETVWHEFSIHSPSTALITLSQKDFLDN